MGKKKSNVAVLAVAFVIVGAIVGAAGVYWWQQYQYEAGVTYGMAYQQSIDTTNVPASLTCALLSPSFANFATDVAADGSVTTAATKYTTFYVNNSDDTRTAEDVSIRLYNPVTDKDGLHENLETEETSLSITSGGGTYKLYNEAEYITSGYAIGDIPPAGAWSLNFSMTLSSAVAGTYQNGQTYTCHAYVYQADADYCDVVDFTVTT